MGVLAGCDARHRARCMVTPCKRPVTLQRACQCSQNVQVIQRQALSRTSRNQTGKYTPRPLVMAAERTFREKATAAHVYCLQGRLRDERYSRHWYDLAAIAKTAHFENAIRDQQLAIQVAAHKSMFFSEKDTSGAKIDYVKTPTGSLRLIPYGMHTTLPSFRRRPESRLSEHKLDPGLRRDDGVFAMCA